MTFKPEAWVLFSNVSYVKEYDPAPEPSHTIQRLYRCMAVLVRRTEWAPSFSSGTKGPPQREVRGVNEDGTLVFSLFVPGHIPIHLHDEDHRILGCLSTPGAELPDTLQNCAYIRIQNTQFFLMDHDPASPIRLTLIDRDPAPLSTYHHPMENRDVPSDEDRMRTAESLLLRWLQESGAPLSTEDVEQRRKDCQTPVTLLDLQGATWKLVQQGTAKFTSDWKLRASKVPSPSTLSHPAPMDPSEVLSLQNHSPPNPRGINGVVDFLKSLTEQETPAQTHQIVQTLGKNTLKAAKNIQRFLNLLGQQTESTEAFDFLGNHLHEVLEDEETNPPELTT